MIVARLWTFCFVSYCHRSSSSFMRLLVYPFVSVAYGAFPEHLMTQPVEPVRRFRFYPANAGPIRWSNKPKLAYGTPDHNIRVFNRYIEEIPPENRLEILTAFKRMTNRREFLQETSSMYHLNVRSSFIIEIRLFRLLVRLALNVPLHDETDLYDACSILNHLQHKYPHEFDHLTPDYILEWYKVVGEGSDRFYVSWKDWGRLERDQPDLHFSDPTTPLFVLISLNKWKSHILDPRIERLKLTGYETVH